MEIRTKFSVGDEVWTIDCVETVDNNVEWFVSHEREIIGITISVTDDKEDEISIQYDLYDDCAYEERCFATKEEAQKECDRRNEKTN